MVTTLEKKGKQGKIYQIKDFDGNLVGTFQAKSWTASKVSDIVSSLFGTEKQIEFMKYKKSRTKGIFGDIIVHLD